MSTTLKHFLIFDVLFPLPTHLSFSIHASPSGPSFSPNGPRHADTEASKYTDKQNVNPWTSSNSSMYALNILLPFLTSIILLSLIGLWWFLLNEGILLGGPLGALGSLTGNTLAGCALAESKLARDTPFAGTIKGLRFAELLYRTHTHT